MQQPHHNEKKTHTKQNKTKNRGSFDIFLAFRAKTKRAECSIMLTLFAGCINAFLQHEPGGCLDSFEHNNFRIRRRKAPLIGRKEKKKQKEKNTGS